MNHATYKFSITIKSDDLAVVNCLLQWSTVCDHCLSIRSRAVITAFHGVVQKIKTGNLMDKA